MGSSSLPISYATPTISRLLPLPLTDHSQTKFLQESLAECGWQSAAQLCQQDTSEAFTFITGQLELPLLTLKMDLFHTGKEEPDDDHRFVNERLLEVAILTEPPEGSDVITLEACLESYFNNRIEVRRHMLERQRSNTMHSSRSVNQTPSNEKSSAIHIETVESIQDEGEGVISESPVSELPTIPVKSPLGGLRPSSGRNRADSIFSQRRVPTLTSTKPEEDSEKKNLDRPRKGSIRTEVLMPAWQFFKLLPWYTDNVPTTDAQVAAHFSRKRPVLGIALKRYQVSNQGVASRLSTYIDIPLEIAVPNFVSDDDMDDDSPLVGNFKLVLQSVVCHRGHSVNSGHYVSLVRGQAANAQGSRPGSSAGLEGDDDPWMLFDDMAKDRVTYVDIEQKLKEECPYLLFYQVQPIDEDLLFGDPPSYEETMSRVPSDDMSDSPEKPTIIEEPETISDAVIVEQTPRSPTSPNGGPHIFGEGVDWSTSTRTSLEINTAPEDPSSRGLPRDIRGRSSMSSNRSGIDDVSATSGSVKGGTSIPTTPLEDYRSSFLGLSMSRRSSRAGIKSKSKSRNGSEGAEEREGRSSGRFGLNLSMSKLANMGRSPSRNDIMTLAANTEDSVLTPTLAKPPQQQDKEPKPKEPVGEGSIAGSLASLGEITAGSTESLGSTANGPVRPDTIAVAEMADEKGKKKWKERMEDKKREREEKQARRKLEKGKTVSSKNGEVPERECAVM